MERRRRRRTRRRRRRRPRSPPPRPGSQYRISIHGKQRSNHMDWLFATLKQYPEIAIFLTLGIGYYFGKFTFKGIGLGSVTATLLAGVLIGQIGITIAQPLKATVFLMFLFAVGYGVGPQFVRGVARDGLPQAIFAVIQAAFSLAACVVIAKVA